MLASYGTERRWYESSHRVKHASGEAREGFPSRLDGYLDCNLFEIQETAFLAWSRKQYFDKTDAFRTLEKAVTSCIDGAVAMSYADSYKSVIVEIKSKHELYRNLSDGQKVMLSLIGDLVRRANYLNPHFGDSVLDKTPGVVLIDELDMHLHPKWQRRIIHELKRTFPLVQFITTTHSPQLIGEALPSEIRVLSDWKVYPASHSLGLDSSRVLEEIQGASRRSPLAENLIHQIAIAVDKDEYERARILVSELERMVGSDDAEVVRPRSLMKFMEMPL
jgi:predicted ATP-binding protein involved in virulence